MERPFGQRPTTLLRARTATRRRGDSGNTRGDLQIPTPIAERGAPAIATKGVGHHRKVQGSALSDQALHDSLHVRFVLKSTSLAMRRTKSLSLSVWCTHVPAVRLSASTAIVCDPRPVDLLTGAPNNGLPPEPAMRDHGCEAPVRGSLLGAPVNQTRGRRIRTSPDGVFPDRFPLTLRKVTVCLGVRVAADGVRIGAAACACTNPACVGKTNNDGPLLSFHEFLGRFSHRLLTSVGAGLV